jgi:hypothetical protein
MNKYSMFRWRTGMLVYQAPDWAWFIKGKEMNRRSI